VGLLLKPRAEPLDAHYWGCVREVFVGLWTALISVRITACHRHPLFVWPTSVVPSTPSPIYCVIYTHTHGHRSGPLTVPRRPEKQDVARLFPSQERKGVHVMEYQCARVSLSRLRCGHVARRFRRETVAGKSAASCHFSNVIKYCMAGVYKCSTTIIKPVFSEFSSSSSVSFIQGIHDARTQCSTKV